MIQFCIRTLTALALLGVVLLAPGTAQAAPLTQEDLPNLVETAVGAGNFTTLVAALQAAGLDETLQGDGPFTVFAPTDEAFAALPEGTVEALLADPSGALTDILLYHVVAGTVMAVDAVNAIGGSLEMVNGQTTTLTVEGSRLLLNSSGFVAMDIAASNGVIHVIDQVLIPSTPVAEPAAEAEAADTSAADAAESMAMSDTMTTTVESPVATEAMTETADMTETMAVTMDIVDTAIAAGDFTTLVAAVQAAGLVETLQGEGPFTVFAPTDEAFAALPEGTIDALLADPSGALTDILLYHVVAGKVMAADVITMDGEQVATVGGKNVTVSISANGVLINDAEVVMADIEASNGVIHVIDAVLIPSAEEAEGDASMAEPAAEEAAMADADEGCRETYHIQAGDTLSQIAAIYGVNVQTLVQSNNISNPNRIYRGQPLCIP